MVITDIVKLIVIGLISRYLPWSAGVSLAMWWGKERAHLSQWRMVGILGLGIYENIVRIQSIGLRSAWLMSLMVVTWLIARNYQSRLNWWWYGLAMVGEAVIQWQWQAVVMQLLCLLVVEGWSKRFSRHTEIYVKK